MAQLTDCDDRNCTTHDALLPEGELAVLVCLMAVPVIWTVLIAAMVSSCAAVTTMALLLALAVGGIADVARLVWLHRRVVH